MDKKEIEKRAEEIIGRLTLEQKLAQLNGMFCGAQIPVAILHRFENGLGEIAVMPGANHKEENFMAAQEEQDAVMSHCGIPAIRHNEAVTGLMDADSTYSPPPSAWARHGIRKS